MSEYISIAEVDSWLNFQLIDKPEQSGKTFIIMAIIQHFGLDKYYMIIVPLAL